MQALVYEAPRVMTMRDVPPPTPGPREVVVRVAYSGICGSELSGFLGTNSLRRPPLVFGHELSGWVDSLGSEVAAHDWPVGTRVTANPLSSCGRCPACLTGQQQRCPNRRLLGAHVAGSNAQLVAVPVSSLLAVPEHVDLRDAAIVEPVACAVRAVGVSGVTPTCRAVVVGAGPIGLFILQVLAQYGVQERYVVELNPTRRAMAAATGAIALDPRDQPVDEQLRARTGGVELAFDAVGSAQARTTCLASTAAGGSVLLVGLHTDETSLPLNTVVRSEIRLLGVFGYNESDVRTALDWVCSDRVGLTEGLVVAPLVDGPDWYHKLVEGHGAAKVLLTPQPLG